MGDQTESRAGRHIHRPTFVAGCLLLVIASYFDSIRGPALPRIADDIGLTLGAQSQFLVFANLLAALSMLFSMGALRRFSVRVVALGVAALMVAVSAYAQTVHGPLGLWGLGAFLGVVIGLGGGLSNILVIGATGEQVRSQALLALHVMYGAGSMVAAAVAGRWLAAGMDWRSLFLFAIPAIGLLAIALREDSPAGSASPPARNHEMDSSSGLGRVPAQAWLGIAVFAAYVSGEVGTSMWMVTYLVSKGQAIDAASTTLSGFFLVLTVARLAAIAVLTPARERWFVYGCPGLALGSFALALGLDEPGWLAGVGILGPFFPIFIGQLSRDHPKSWRAVALWIALVMQATQTLLHVTMGHLGSGLGIERAFLLAPGAIFLTGLGAWLYLRLARNTTGPQPGSVWT